MSFTLLFGILALVLGASIVAHALFDIDIPLFRTALGVALVYLGARVLIGAWSPERASAGRDAVFSVSRFAPRDPTEIAGKYDIVFGRGLVDLTNIGTLEHDRSLQIDVVFGDAVIEVDPSTPIDVRGNAAFAELRMPDGSGANFGDVLYRAPVVPGTPRLELRVNVVFGSATVRSRATETAPRPLVAEGAQP
jgi:hypothetical protein